MAQGVVSLTGELELIAGEIVLFTERCVFSRLQPESCEEILKSVAEEEVARSGRALPKSRSGGVLKFCKLSEVGLVPSCVSAAPRYAGCVAC